MVENSSILRKPPDHTKFTHIAPATITIEEYSMILSIPTDMESLGKQCSPSYSLYCFMNSVCHSVCIVWMHYYMVKTTMLKLEDKSSVQMFWIFTVLHKGVNLDFRKKSRGHENLPQTRLKVHLKYSKYNFTWENTYVSNAQ